MDFVTITALCNTSGLPCLVTPRVANNRDPGVAGTAVIAYPFPLPTRLTAPASEVNAPPGTQKRST
ncbi:MAG: hypothetical protein EBU85_03355 [Actinobacteria bacterium]|nr:hypothetical protein [Actinomycetota bacterium]